jgi:hypothetical protein
MVSLWSSSLDSIAKRTIAGDPEEGDSSLEMPEDKIMEAATLLFDSDEISGKEVRTYVHLHQRIPTQSIPPPAQFTTASNSRGYEAGSWRNRLLKAVTCLGGLILTFANVADPEEAAGLLLNQDLFVMDAKTLQKGLWEWDGCSNSDLWHSVWLASLHSLMANGSIEHERFSLVSERGWTVYLPSFGNPDPAKAGKSNVSHHYVNC